MDKAKINSSQQALYDDFFGRNFKQRNIEQCYQRWLKDPSKENMHELTLAFYPICFKQAAYWHNKATYIPIDDFFNEGMKGFLASLKGFDASMGNRFCTYATHFIKGYMQSLRDRDLGVAEHAHRRGYGCFSHNDDFTFAETFEDPNSVIDQFEDDDAFRAKMNTLYEAMNQLEPREREIIMMRFLQDKTLEECGKAFNISKERARQIQNTALERIKDLFDLTVLKKDVVCQ